MIKEEDVQALMQIGFTSNQAKLYITLLSIGKADGRTIAKHSQVPRQEVYRILDELQEMGLVEKIIALPCEFEAVPMQDGLSILLAQKAKEYSEAEKKTKVLLQKFEPNEEKTLRETQPKFIIIPGKETYIQKIRNMHDNAQRSVDCVTTSQRFLQAVHHGFEIYQKALERGVKYRVIIEKPEAEKAFPKTVQYLLAKPNFQLRLIGSPPKTIAAIFDGREATFCFYLGAPLAESPVIWTNHPSFLAMGHDHFENVWKEAQEYKLKKTDNTRT